MDGPPLLSVGRCVMHGDRSVFWHRDYPFVMSSLPDAVASQIAKLFAQHDPITTKIQNYTPMMTESQALELRREATTSSTPVTEDSVCPVAKAIRCSERPFDNHCLTHYPARSDCAICVAAKASRGRMKPGSASITSNFLVMDILTCTQGHGGARYALIVGYFAPGIRWYCSIALVRATAEAAAHGLALALNRFGIVDKDYVVHTDWGLAFTGEEFTTAVNLSLGKRWLGIPHRHNSNSRAENVVRFIADGGRTLLLQSGLPVQFWPQALSTFAHNVSLAAANPLQTRNIVQPIVFGQFGYVVVDPETRQQHHFHRMEPSTVPCVFLTYAFETSAGICILTASKGARQFRYLTVSFRDVIFQKRFGLFSSGCRDLVDSTNFCVAALWKDFESFTPTVNTIPMSCSLCSLLRIVPCSTATSENFKCADIDLRCHQADPGTVAPWLLPPNGNQEIESFKLIQKEHDRIARLPDSTTSVQLNPAVSCILTLIRGLRRLPHLHELSLAKSNIEHVPNSIWALLPKLRTIDISDSVFQDSLNSERLASWLDVSIEGQFIVKHSRASLDELSSSLPSNVRLVCTYTPPPRLCEHECWNSFRAHHAVTPLEVSEFTTPDSSTGFRELLPLDGDSPTSKWVLAAVKQAVNVDIPPTTIFAKFRDRMASLDTPESAPGPWQPWRISIFKDSDGKLGGFIDLHSRGRVHCRGSEVWHFFGQTVQSTSNIFESSMAKLFSMLPRTSVVDEAPPIIVPHRTRGDESQRSWGSDADVVSTLGPFLWSFRSHAETARHTDGEEKMVRALDDPSWHQVGGHSFVSVCDLSDEDHKSMIADIAGIHVACSETAALESAPKASAQALSIAADRALAYAITLKQNPGLATALLGSIPSTKDEFIRAGELLACAADAKFLQAKAGTMAKRLNVKVQAIVVSVKEALKSADKIDWEAAIDKECGGLINENSVLRPCSPSSIPANADILPAMLVLCRKPDKLKGRIVACGNYQQVCESGCQTFAPVVARDAWLTTLVIGLKQRKEVRTVDITQAFLQSSEEFRPEKPTFLKPNSAVQASLERLGYARNSLLEVVKSIYGLRSAPRSWQRTLNQFLKSKGYRPHPLDPTVWIKSSTYILVYVDDLLCVGMPKDLDMFETDLKNTFKVGEFSKLSNEPLDFVGHSIWIDDDNVLHVSQERLVTQFLARFGFSESSKGSNAPLVPTPASHPSRSCGIDSDGLTILRSVVGGSAYVAAGSRPDTMVFTSMLAEQQSPTKASGASLNDCKKLLRYYQATRGRHVTVKINHWEDPLRPEGLEVWADSSFSDSYSRGGAAIGMGGSAFLWRSARHRMIVLSTCESELVGMSSAIRYAIGLQNFIQHLIGAQMPKIKLYADNTAACCISQSVSDLRKVRHLSLADLYIRQACSEDLVSIQWIPTHEMYADALTKCPGKKEMESLSRAFNIRDDPATANLYEQMSSVEVLKSFTS